MSILFVSDVHLSARRPTQARAFLALLAGLDSRARALYLLGDIFDAWIGDDYEHPLHAEVANALHTLRDGGTAVYLMHGNHDFLLAEGYAARCGACLLPDPAVIEVNGSPVLLSHGDQFCSDDVEYQAFRRWSRDPVNQRAFLAMSLQDRAEKAAELQKQSRADTQRKAADIMDVNAETVSAALREHHATTLVHGHTHRPATHLHRVDDQPCTRYVLGDWYDIANARVLYWPADGEPALVTPAQAAAALATPH